MRFLVADGGEGGHHHVKAIEPGPALNEVKSRRARENDNRERQSNQAQIAKSFHENSGWSFVAG
jgi:hypothetical protein